MTLLYCVSQCEHILVVLSFRRYHNRQDPSTGSMFNSGHGRRIHSEPRRIGGWQEADRGIPLERESFTSRAGLWATVEVGRRGRPVQ